MLTQFICKDQYGCMRGNATKEKRNVSIEDVFLITYILLPIIKSVSSASKIYPAFHYSLPNPQFRCLVEDNIISHLEQYRSLPNYSPCFYPPHPPFCFFIQHPEKWAQSITEIISLVAQNPKWLPSYIKMKSQVLSRPQRP